MRPIVVRIVVRIVERMLQSCDGAKAPRVRSTFMNELSTPASTPGRLWLASTVFVTGSAVMLVEVLGARTLSPFFGVGLFSWSALIAVTMTALAAGYFLGGAWARRIDRSRFYALVMVAGLLVALIPVLRAPVLELSDGFDLRLAALQSAALLFGPALTLLGFLSPVAVKLFADGARGPGDAAGRVFGISTAGGLLGTILTGFVLIPEFSLSSIYGAAATTLIATGGIGRLICRKRLVGLLLIPLPLLLSPQKPSDEPLPDVRVLARASSVYGEVSVIEDRTRGAVPLRLLRSDQSIIGAQWPESREPAFGFVHLLEGIKRAYPRGETMLLIGLGIGSLSDELRDDGVRVDVVEIDKNVVEFARDYFGFSPTGKVYVEDARTFIEHSNEKYDFIVHDTFTGGSTPEHLLTVEFLIALRDHLHSGGVLGLNLVGAHEGPLAEPAHVVAATLREVFPHVRIFRDHPPSEGPEELGNLVFFASDRPLDFDDFSSVARDSKCAAIQRNFPQWEVTDFHAGNAEISTDDRNPLAELSMPVVSEFRSSMRELYPTELWLH